MSNSIGGEGPLKLKPLPKPKPVQGPNPWHIANTLGNDVVTGLPGAPPPPAPPPPPPPIDFNALTLSDPQYTQGKANLEAQNQITLEGLLNSFRRTGQSAQDNANAHGALFSGAAVNAQRSIGQDYANQQRQQALNLQAGNSTNYFNVFNRLMQQIAGGQ